MPPSPAISGFQKRMSRPRLSIEDLPVEFLVDILSRLPVKLIIHCKCVSKKWLDLITDSYFADLQLSRSPAGLMIYCNPKEYRPNYLGVLRWTEVEDELDHHHLHHDPVMSLDLNLAPIFQNTQMQPVGSVNGLLCLWQSEPSDNTYICNPITREYMVLLRQQYYRQGPASIVHCFGVSSLTREYKVIRIFQGNIPPDSTSTSRPSLLEAEVYTLGTGQWRSLGHVSYWLQGGAGPFLNGHAHWKVIDKNSSEKLFAFDFDKETFELFPSPPCEAIDESLIYKALGVLKGCLCQCNSYDSNLTVWVMKEYGIKKSWHKELVMDKSIRPGLDLEALGIVDILEVFKDGSILMASYQDTIFTYCPRKKTIVVEEIFEYFFDGLTYRPSFHRLQNFETERVHVF